ncbi:hypothetical protein C8Q70DRAFT_118492 [Cubamyces menziesii]|nr:hypothetical protein C8Q70DRAFT_118492 [Cubamyces menziesii]
MRVRDATLVALIRAPPAVRLLSIGTSSPSRVAPSSLTSTPIFHPPDAAGPPRGRITRRETRTSPTPPSIPSSPFDTRPLPYRYRPQSSTAYASPLAPTPQSVGVARGSSLRHSRRARHAYTYTRTRRVCIRPRCALRGRARRRARRIVGMVAVGVRSSLWGTAQGSSDADFGRVLFAVSASDVPDGRTGIRARATKNEVRRLLRLCLVSQGHHKCRARLRMNSYVLTGASRRVACANSEHVSVSGEWHYLSVPRIVVSVGSKHMLTRRACDVLKECACTTSSTFCSVGRHESVRV